ncbi:ATP-binding cassette domain-containing protein [Alkalibaculum sp. M08DMB]|uniref:ATP-binding cassette domain-containing protein n=1 Tax=Alkalibaculum sporogenes TaxID=2655001 RepID=A0A6A7K5X5_9FIRM|nr:ABC-F family ATP-binding cassette domain-containing protein [Alkalibaculum sporogenes]MPW24889.1 ATP-binding cassette domain-containing protein [Alkalibaculum sporogenes]
MLTCNSITKSFGITLILENITFKIDRNDRIGIVGRNGSGKSTLFKILTNNLEFDSGEININKNISIGYLSQNLDLNEDNNIYHEMLHVFQDLLAVEKEMHKYQELMSISKDLDPIMNKYSILVETFENQGGYEVQSRIRGVLNGLGFNDEDQQKKIKELSGGQKTRVALGKLLLLRPELFLLDEPTNYLDMNAIHWLENYLDSYNGALVIISHDRYFLDALVNKTFEIENNKLTQYSGNYTQYLQRKKENLETSLHHYDIQQKEIQRQQEIIKRFKQYNREKSIKRAESREKMLEKIDILEKPMDFHKKAQIRFEPQVTSGKVVLDAIHLKKSFDKNMLFQNVNFNILRGEKVGIIGANGTGKTTLLNIIKGDIVQDEGEVIYGHNVNIGFFHQEHEDLIRDNDILTEVWQASSSAKEGEIRSFLAAFMFTGEDVYKKIHSLSGGEISRVSLAKLMLSKSNLLLMDEPTNHLDMETKDILENALENYTGTVLLISHDRYFLNRVVDKLLVLDNNGITIFQGNYDYYLNKIDEARMIEEESTIDTKMTKTQLTNLRKKENIEKQKLKELKKEISDLESLISTLETQIKEIEELMCKENFYEDFDNSTNITNQYDKIKEDLDNIINLWAEKQSTLEILEN